MAFSVAGLVLSPAAVLLPFVTVDKLGAERVTHLLTGVGEVWAQGLHWVGVWVLVCGALAPLMLLSLLVVLLAGRRERAGWFGGPSLGRAARALDRWAMPEVHVLAVLVAFTKLETVVNVRLGGGFWCYLGVSLCFLLAWRSYELSPAGDSAVQVGEGCAHE